MLGVSAALLIHALDSVSSDHTFTRPDDGLIRPAAVSQPKPLAPLALQLVGALLAWPGVLLPHLLAERHDRDPAFPATPPLVRREPVLPNQEPRHHRRRPTHHPEHDHVRCALSNLRLALHVLP